MRELFFATIVLMTTVAIVILMVSIFSGPFFAVNEALIESANYSNNTGLVSELEDVTGKTEMMWLGWPVVFIIGLIVWYYVWGQKWIYERY